MPPTIFRYSLLERVSLLDRFKLVNMARVRSTSTPPPRRHPTTGGLRLLSERKKRELANYKEQTAQTEAQAGGISSIAPTSATPTSATLTSITPTSTAPTSAALFPRTTNTTAAAEKAIIAARNRVNDAENEIDLTSTTPSTASSLPRSVSTTSVAENTSNDPCVSTPCRLILGENRGLTQRIEQLEHENRALRERPAFDHTRCRDRFDNVLADRVRWQNQARTWQAQAMDRDAEVQRLTAQNEDLQARLFAWERAFGPTG